MLGTILGDIIGSPFIKNNVKTKDFILFSDASWFTANTVTSLAVAKGLKDGYGNHRKTRSLVLKALKEGTSEYPKLKYGKEFSDWLKTKEPIPYISGNCDAAIRVTACAWIYNSLKYVEYYAELTAKLTHKSPEAIKAAKALSAVIFLARQGNSKDYIKNYITDVYYYELDKTVDDYRKNDSLVIEAKEIFPAAFAAFYECESYEDAVRNAVSLGGDSGLLAGFAGGMAEGAYPIPEDLIFAVIDRLDGRLKGILKEYHDFVHILRENRINVINQLMECKPFFDKRSKTEWYAPKPVDNLSPFPYPKYGDEVVFLEQIVQDKDFADFNYEDTLARYDMDTARLKDYNEKAKEATPYLLRAMLTAIVRRERFVDGNIAEAVRFGVISTILEELGKKDLKRLF